MHVNIKQEIIAHEENLTQATRQLDVEALECIYADDVMFTGVTGTVCNKSALMGEARRGVTAETKVVAYDKEDIKVFTAIRLSLAFAS